MSNTAPQSVPLSVLSDEALVLRAQDGSLPCFAELLRRSEGKVFNFILRRIGGAGAAHRSDAEDLTQETFLRAWEHLRSFTPRFRFSTWLYTIAGRVSIDHLRSRRVRQDALAQMRRHAEADSSREEDGFSQVIGQQEHLAHGSALWNEAERVLTVEQHAALWLRYAEDLSPPEIGRVLGRTQVAVRVMLFRARKTLAKHVMQSRDRHDDKAACLESQWSGTPDDLQHHVTPHMARRSRAMEVEMEIEVATKPVAGGVA